MATSPPDSAGSQPITYPLPAYPEVHLPPTLDWYRQAANWLVGLATGVLAVGLSSADKIPFETPGQQWIACLCIVCFLVTVGSGIAFYFWITSFANCLERREKFTNWHQNATTEDLKKEYLRKHVEADEASVRAGSWYTFFYNGMMWSFLAATLCMVLTLIGILRAEPTPKTPELTIFGADKQTFMVDKMSGTTWILTTDPAHHLTWQPVDIPLMTRVTPMIGPAKK